jgi:hypothetical protein
VRAKFPPRLRRERPIALFGFSFESLSKAERAMLRKGQIMTDEPQRREDLGLVAKA